MLALYFAFEQSPRFVEGVEKSGISLAHYKIKNAIDLPLSILCYVLGAGVFSLKEWSRKGILLITTYYFVYGVINVVKISSEIGLKSTTPIIFSIALAAWVLYYLTRPDIKQKFK